MSPEPAKRKNSRNSNRVAWLTVGRPTENLSCTRLGRTIYSRFQRKVAKQSLSCRPTSPSLGDGSRPTDAGSHTRLTSQVLTQFMFAPFLNSYREPVLPAR